MLLAAAGGSAAGGAFWFSVSFSAVFLLNTLHPIAYAIIFREKGLGSALYIKEEDAPALYETKDNDDTPTDSASQRVSTPSSAVMRPVADDNNVDNAPSQATPSKFSSAHICNRLADYCSDTPHKYSVLQAPRARAFVRAVERPATALRSALTAVPSCLESEV